MPQNDRIFAYSKSYLNIVDIRFGDNIYGMDNALNMSAFRILDILLDHGYGCYLRPRAQSHNNNNNDDDGKQEDKIITRLMNLLKHRITEKKALPYTLNKEATNIVTKLNLAMCSDSSIFL